MPWTPSSLGDLELRAWKLIETTPAPGRHAARNAVFQIERAYGILATDPEMAVFRLITGEEEAVRAIFHALQRHNYPNARRLNWQDHRHKAAVVPFIRAIADLIAKASFAQPELGLEKEDGNDVMSVRIKVPGPDGSGHMWLRPKPPLDFLLEIDGKPHDFRPEIEALLGAVKVAEFEKFVRGRANERNRLLYATEQGLPQVTGNVRDVLDAARGRIFTELAIFLLIDTVNVQQRFVVQALDAFVRLMDLIPPEGAP